MDVGYGTLAWTLRTDPRVRVMERTNARGLTPERCCPYTARPGDDRRVVHLAGQGAGARCSGAWRARYDVLALVKPQFEVGRGRVGKGGVVREAEDRRAALLGVGEAALALGASVLGYHSSGLPGPKGNRETFVWLAEPGARAARADVRRARGDGAQGREP